MNDYRQLRWVRVVGLVMAAWLLGNTLLLGAEPTAKPAPAVKPAKPPKAPKAPPPPPPPWVAPSLPDGQLVVHDQDPAMLVPPTDLPNQPGPDTYAVAKEAPLVDFAYFPGQDHAGRPWSGWGQGCFTNGRYYAAIGDHAWNAYIYEYDPVASKLTQTLDIRAFLAMPEGHYTPGKVHSQLGAGQDGWIYFATHNGGGGRATPENHYAGDWLMRVHPGDAKAEIIAHGPAGLASIPTGLFDAQRQLFYGGTEQELRFLAYDVAKKEQLFLSEPNQGPSRAIIFSQSTGRVYVRVHGKEITPARRFDPTTRELTVMPDLALDPRSTTRETKTGLIYAADWVGQLWVFDVKTERATVVGSLNIGPKTYITSLALDPTERYLYYSAGAHGGARGEGTPIMQYDLKTKTRKVIAFLAPFYTAKYSYTPDGTYSTVLSDDGAILFNTWNGNRVGTKGYGDVVALTAIHLPASERP
jgi:hypothetical protein